MTELGIDEFGSMDLSDQKSGSNRMRIENSWQDVDKQLLLCKIVRRLSLLTCFNRLVYSVRASAYHVTVKRAPFS